jgi:tRNA(fMet)-specific endonuclease VapC
MQHQHGSESASVVIVASFMDSFLHQASFVTGYWSYDRHRSVRWVIMVGLAIDQIAPSGLSNPHSDLLFRYLDGILENTAIL